MCVSFTYEENDKGPTAKDLREEDPERVARVTAVRRYGRVTFYADPPREELTNGYGFIVPIDQHTYGAPTKYYFHMDSITTPDEDDGLWPEDYVSFIVVPARKGFQAIEVTLEEKSNIPQFQKEHKAEAGMEREEVSSVVDNPNGLGVAEPPAPTGKENKAPTVEADDEWDSWT